jgi:hypothetical protein
LAVNMERMRDKRSAYRVLVGKSELHKWEDNIKIDLKINQIIGCRLDLSGSGMNQWGGCLVNTVMKLRGP